jgi:hypothetical protein
VLHTPKRTAAVSLLSVASDRLYASMPGDSQTKVRVYPLPPEPAKQLVNW